MRFVKVLEAEIIGAAEGGNDGFRLLAEAAHQLEGATVDEGDVVDWLAFDANHLDCAVAYGGADL